MAFLDKDRSGTIDMGEFLVGVRVISLVYVISLRDNQTQEDR